MIIPSHVLSYSVPNSFHLETSNPAIEIRKPAQHRTRPRNLGPTLTLHSLSVPHNTKSYISCLAIKWLTPMVQPRCPIIVHRWRIANLHLHIGS